MRLHTWFKQNGLPMASLLSTIQFKVTRWKLDTVEVRGALPR